ncbi:MAG: hypothetical protein JGK17_10485 [Microcoleus sp. PH2017_10_PVI_O_A]|nr:MULTISPECIES: hypothetical protein [unclassified Microcoleus]MCC3406000.1 hypothetical protein [Microcoleus sp. PH2017_10_PVI_O_A]MCC3460029.1 hypothetical protein [Microcoleus sp. PH2017_11_PCY_U_A]MCC3478529.1 hypothetical protein [Microcoleus sp. PH2017_12_PCY_D_A]MCC3530176.1 hypothetical protein [Microcoleus sp. PH2017_21_RUC_O_A]MCC3542477.1 hypothetical protein [Microcoleus sp. PH2017_22_RUC_O_B]
MSPNRYKQQPIASAGIGIIILDECSAIAPIAQYHSDVSGFDMTADS